MVERLDTGSRLLRATMAVEVKSIDDEERTLSGWATIPRPDRMRDIINPMGARYPAELPLLWQHNPEAPVGWAAFQKPTPKGIRFAARVAKIDKPSTIKTRCDEAWAAVKHHLVRGVSIGFRALATAPLDSGGVHYKSIEIYELSLVTIAANLDATIDTIAERTTESLVPALKILPIVHYRGPSKPCSQSRADGSRHSVRYR